MAVHISDKPNEVHVSINEDDGKVIVNQSDQPVENDV